MSDNVRFHSKHHGKAHHTTASPGYHDSAVDPIASSGSPFMGNFNLSGSHVYYDTSVAADTSKTIGYSDFVDKYDPLYTTVKTQSSSWTVLSGDYWSVTSNTQHPNDLTNNVGIGTNVAGEKLTVSGNISASGGLSALGGINYFGGSVGIGTTSPTADLTVGDGTSSESISINKSTSGTANLNFLNAGNAKVYFQADVDEHLRIATNNSVKMSILENGNVGIGTTAPTSNLHVHGDPGTSNYLAYLYNSGAAGAKHGLNAQIASSAATAYGLRVNTGGSTNTLAAMGDGKVGIGTAAPNHELTVVGDISATGTIHGTDNLPTGGIMSYAGGTAPTGWLLCDGSTVSSTTYNALYLVIGTTYGGDSSNFALPDLRGRMVAGVDAMNNSVGSGGGAASRLAHASTLAAASGTYTETLSTHQIPGHTHEQVHGQLVNSAATAFPSTGNYGGSTFGGGTDDDTAFRSNTFSKGGDQAHNNMPPYLCLNYIIKT